LITWLFYKAKSGKQSLLPTGSYFYLCSTPTIDEEPGFIGAFLLHFSMLILAISLYDISIYEMLHNIVEKLQNQVAKDSYL
jgi:hypothetical protein